LKPFKNAKATNDAKSMNPTELGFAGRTMNKPKMYSKLTDARVEVLFLEMTDNLRIAEQHRINPKTLSQL
jgi:hypothetical protein